MVSDMDNRSPKYTCSFIEQLPPRVHSLVYWKCPIESAIVMIAGFTVLFSLGCLSFISVFAYICLALLCCTTAARVYYDFVKSKTDDPALTPFGDWISRDINISRSRVQDFVNKSLDKSEHVFKYLRHVFLIESYADSLKFAVCAYLLSIVGGFFNLITVVVFAFAILFSAPKFYDIYYPQIDKVLDRCKKHFDKVWSKVKAGLEKIPMLRKQKEN